MNRNLKKIWPALAVSLVLGTSFVNAADNADMTRSKPNTATQNQKGSMGMITPPVNPCVNGVDFSFGVEALYMRATEDSEDVGVHTPASATYPQSYPVVEQQYDNWNWGARVNAGYAMPHDGWNLAAQWTWFRATDNNDRLAETGTTYLSQVANTATGVLANPGSLLVASNGLNSHRRLLMNLGNLDLGREFFISKWLVLRPHVGARGVWINRRLKTETSNIVSYPTGIATSTTDVTTKTKGSYNAGGIYLGLDTQWGFGDGWSLFGNFDQSIVYGKNTVRTNEIDTANRVTYTRYASSDKWNTVRGITDLAVGLRWDYLFGNDAYRFRIQAAWEEHLFSNLDVNNFGSNGNLALTGASFKVAFDF